MRQDPPSRRDRRVSSIASSPAAASAAALRVGWASTRAAIGSLAATPGGSLSRSSRLPPRSLAASRSSTRAWNPIRWVIAIPQAVACSAGPGAQECSS